MARLVRICARLMMAELTAFTIFDTVILAGLYTLGSYFIFDPPLHASLLAVFVFLFGSKRLGVRKIAVWVLCSGTLLLAITGVLAAFLPHGLPFSMPIRLTHQIGSRFILLSVLPYLVVHSRTPLDGHSYTFRVVARLAWIFLKGSLAIGAFVSLLSIKGKLIPIHVALMSIAIPLMVVHVVLRPVRSARAGDPDPQVRPFAIGPLLTPPLFMAAAIGSLVPIGVVTFLAFHLLDTGFSTKPNYMVAGRDAHFEPSPARTIGDVYFRAELMGGSNLCGSPDCHPNVYKEWLGSAHRRGAGPAYRGAVEAVARTSGAPAVRVCAGCHDPVSLYSGAVDFGKELVTPQSIREGISCFACHSLEAQPGVLANGSTIFRFPTFYFKEPHALVPMVGSWREHRRDFLGTSRNFDQLCVSCHRVRPLEDPRLEVLNERWLEADVHAQIEMRAECRGDTGCVLCHMPRTTEPEKPGHKVPSHTLGGATIGSTLYSRSSPSG